MFPNSRIVFLFVPDFEAPQAAVRRRWLETPSLTKNIDVERIVFASNMTNQKLGIGTQGITNNRDLEQVEIFGCPYIFSY